MKKVLDFLTALRSNNDRDWFEAHRPQYKAALEEFNAFVTELIPAIAAFDPLVGGLGVKDCTFRIYRDVRFSHDKSPYKTHMGAYVCPHGKNSGYAGYYFHVEPTGDRYLGGPLLAVGVHMPDPAVLRSLRDEWIDNADGLLAALNRAKGFELDTASKLTRVPKGYPADSPHAEYLKLKNLSLIEYVGEDFMTKPGLLDRTVAEFTKTLEINNILNKAVRFAREEMA